MQPHHTANSHQSLSRCAHLEYAADVLETKVLVPRTPEKIHVEIDHIVANSTIEEPQTQTDHQISMLFTSNCPIRALRPQTPSLGSPISSSLPRNPTTYQQPRFPKNTVSHVQHITNHVQPSPPQRPLQQRRARLGLERQTCRKHTQRRGRHQETRASL